jgi:hypothetical protein
MNRPVIIVHSFEQTCDALIAALEAETAIALVSAPDAGLQSGPACFLSLIEQALDAVPGARLLDVTAMLDCGDKPGCVLEALRHGATRICFTGAAATLAKLSEIAGVQNAVIVTKRPQGLDLLGVAEPRDRCRTWLAGECIDGSN